ncbi:hypothetical protein IVA79_01370 [Bradyrhizobium sp. 138]|uniref:hypothetical protein n=1 Tax=Bradyrhizobium sp. 138 TaxID=2782615 RepID=UPI001FF88177|nr:hypothetical protein [Bradyrhizobium sp. 138]MCK1732631.1 hypothetical protein [Bradyrhizobium sp. 138]
MRAASILLSSMALGLANLASAEDSPAPRRPLGPSERSTQLRTPAQDLLLPSPQLSPLTSDSIRIQNVGDKKLVMAYLDADTSSWKTFTIETGRAAELSCQKCGRQFAVAFHNGKDLKQLQLPAGKSYLLGWSDTGAVWELTSQ